MGKNVTFFSNNAQRRWTRKRKHFAGFHQRIEDRSGKYNIICKKRDDQRPIAQKADRWTSSNQQQINVPRYNNEEENGRNKLTRALCRQEDTT